MSQADRPNSSQLPRWAIAIPASLLCHALIAVLLLRAGVDPTSMASAAERMDPLEIPVKLGIERSDAVTPNWLGFATPTPHVADPAPTEQSPLTRAQGDQRDNFARTMAASMQASTNQALAEARRVLDAFRERFARAQAEARVLAHATAEPESQPVEEPTVEPTPAEPTPAQDDALDGSPGIQDTRSAPPSSKPIEMRRLELGRVVSAEGLKINTSRIHLTSLQRAFRADRSPLVEIFFTHDGRVTRARIPSGRGSGFSDIDQAIINAIYEWTAEGKPIEEMQPGDAPLLIRMRILM